MEGFDFSFLPTLFNNLILFGIAALQIFSMRNSRVRQERNQKKIAEVTDKQDKIYAMVNHPMSVALAALAGSLEQIARMTRSEEDVIAAVNARKASDEHNKKQSEADALKIKNEADKHKIIEDFLKNK